MERGLELHTGTTMLELRLLEVVVIVAWMAVIVLTAWNLLMVKSVKNLVVLLVSIVVPVVGTLIGLVAGGLEWMRRSKAKQLEGR